MQRRGNFSATIRCEIHGLAYGFDGRLRTGSTPGDLTALQLAQPGQLFLVRALGAVDAAQPPGDLIEAIVSCRDQCWTDADGSVTLSA